MSLEKNKALFRKVNEAINKKDLTILDEFMAPDYVDNTNQYHSREEVKQFYTRVFKDFPNFHRTIEDIIAEEDKVCIHLNATATHTGEWNFLGVTLAPTGKKIEYTAVNIWRIRDGKIVESRSLFDQLSMLQQLGHIPPPG